MAATPPRRTIPIAPAAEGEHGACSGAESFALMVLGDSMAPEFAEGDVIVIEPEGLATDGSFVLAQHGGEWIFRQLVAAGDAWRLRPLNPAYPTLDLPDLAAVRGVVIQRTTPGRRKSTTRYGQ
ncbi:MAG TPA: S24 family peptidase [Usitatibacteraceae bacterium]|jgi:SOS-response transcriptional repressor LexA|nr:S24 family peptidase [Usitatibacteraceae bacterium]HQY45768.1 S24 family peptidase [Usitatibacteraceae bacterium]HRA22274.1 S24 family peptidase [Usitatibacteraceae bacterium]